MIAVVTVVEVLVQLSIFLGVVGINVAPIVDFCE